MAERANVYPLRREPKPEPGPQQPGPQQPRPQQPPPPEPLWREVLGRLLHALRQRRQETLSETAGRAGMSPQYLSEIERGRKEPSSEMIAALPHTLAKGGVLLIVSHGPSLRHDRSERPRTLLSADLLTAASNPRAQPSARRPPQDLSVFVALSVAARLPSGMTAGIQPGV
jgi:transcriptional regulator with XRE-family HTH domain